MLPAVRFASNGRSTGLSGEVTEREGKSERGAAPSCFLVEKGCFFSFCYFFFLVAFVAFVVVLFPQSPLPACESENATKCSEL